MSSEVEREPVAVPREQATGVELVASPSEKAWRAHDPDHDGRSCVRITEPAHRRSGELAPRSACFSSDLGLPRSWKSAPSRTAERRAGIGGSLDDREDVLVERQLRARRLSSSNPIDGSNSGQERGEDAGVPGEPERLRGSRSEQELRELAHAVGGEPATDPLARDERDAAASSCICASVPRPARARAVRRTAGRGRSGAGPPRSSRGETVRRTPRSRSSRAAERIDELAVGEAPRHRVDREVAPAEVVLDARLRVDDDLEVVAARAGRALAPRRRELDSGRRERRSARSRG